jgi:hypothetical protein
MSNAKAVYSLDTMLTVLYFILGCQRENMFLPPRKYHLAYTVMLLNTKAKTIIKFFMCARGACQTFVLLATLNIVLRHG